MAKKLVVSEEHRLSDLTGVGRTIIPLAKQLLGKNGFMQIELISNWEEIVGERLAEYVLPQKISFVKDERVGGTLVLLVLSGAFAMEVESNKLKILQKVNAFFGYEALNKIKIIQTSNPENFLKTKNVYDKPKKNLVSEKQKTYINELTESIDNESLRLKLEEIGREILKDKK
jgi:hypothetical protein